MSVDQIILILQLSVAILVVIMIVLICVYFLVGRKKEEKQNSGEEFEINEKKNEETNNSDEFGKFQGVLTKESIFDFMEFDEITDNMIIRKKGSQYVMVLQCNGINYDLMSQNEKYAVEEGFVQFLNTIRFPIQIYVQSRTLNLKEIVESYKARIAEITKDIANLDSKLIQTRKEGNKALIEKLEFEKRRKTNVLEYGENITEYVEKLSSNENILQQRTYIIISYYKSEIGISTSNYTKEEINNMCFSELYTRCQNVINSLMSTRSYC